MTAELPHVAPDQARAADRCPRAYRFGSRCYGGELIYPAKPVDVRGKERSI